MDRFRNSYMKRYFSTKSFKTPFCSPPGFLSPRISLENLLGIPLRILQKIFEQFNGGIFKKSYIYWFEKFRYELFQEFLQDFYSKFVRRFPQKILEFLDTFFFKNSLGKAFKILPWDSENFKSNSLRGYKQD